MTTNKNRASELKAMPAAGLLTELMALTKAQFGMRMQVATQQMTNTSELRKVRRDIARIKTVLAQKDVQI
ncbi:MAG TPA: 50S ribosomal protein L29 [Gallionella sp.]|nr:50S ribosomal protein L29 [Gallionella sp.]